MRRARGEARRAAILAAARETLVDHGLEQFVLRTIATSVGIELGNLQYYFATRADLLEAVIRAEFEHDVAAVRSAREQLDLSGPQDPYGQMVTALIRNWTVAGGGRIFSALWELSHHDARFHRLSTEIYETFYAQIRAMLHAADPSAAERDVAARAHLMTAILDGVSVQINAAIGTDEKARRVLMAGATDLLRSIASGERSP
jgi:AcrR family transcriptional regulator